MHASVEEALHVELCLRRRNVPIIVHPIIAPSGITSLKDGKPIAENREVAVLRAGSLRSSLPRRRVFSPEQVDLITAAAVDPTTWDGRWTPRDDSSELQRGWGLIDRGIDRWNMFVLGVGALIVISLTSTALAIFR